MRIGISCYPTYGGSGVVASELALHLVKRGHRVHVLSYELPARLRSSDVELTPHQTSTTAVTRGARAVDDRPGLFFHRVDVKHYPLFDYPPYSLALANEIVQVTRQHHLQLIHVHYAVPNAVSALLAQQILAPTPLPVVTTLHGTDVTLVGNDPSYLSTTRWSVERSDAVTAVSAWLEAKTREQLGDEHSPITRAIEVIPNFVEASRFAACTPKLGELPVLVHVSNFRRVKRAADVIEAFALVRRSVPCRLRMVGEGPDKAAAQEQARALGLDSAIEWRGNDPDVERALDGCALFLLASEQESFGLAALEAQAAGVPVVSTRVGGVEDVVLDGKTGLLVEAQDPRAMALAVESMLRDPQRWAAMSAEGRRDAKARFSAESVVERYLAVYRGLLTSPREPESGDAS